MNFSFLQLELDMPEGLQHQEMRRWIVGEIGGYGKPLRWAITDLDLSTIIRTVKVEAVVLVSDG